MQSRNLLSWQSSKDFLWPCHPLKIFRLGILTTFVDFWSRKTIGKDSGSFHGAAHTSVRRVFSVAAAQLACLMERSILISARYARYFEMPVATWIGTAISSMAIQPRLKKFVITLKPSLPSSYRVILLLPRKPNHSSCKNPFFYLVLSLRKCLPLPSAPQTFSFLPGIKPFSKVYFLVVIGVPILALWKIPKFFDFLMIRGFCSIMLG